jgi:hypothetical protein
MRNGKGLGAPFWWLFGAYSVNAVGDEFYAIALPLALLATGYPQYTVTAVFGVVIAATVIGGFAGGFVADSWRTHQLLVGVYAASAAALAAGAVAVLAGAGGFVVALVVAAALGPLAAISAAGVDAGVPRTLRDTAQIKRGYSLVESSRTAATIAGPALAGVAATVGGVAAVFALNASSFAIAAALMMSGGASVRSGRDDARGLGGTGPSLRVVVAGISGVLRQPALRLGVGLSFVLNVALGAEQPLFLSRLVAGRGLAPVTASLVITAAGIVSIGSALVFGAVRSAVPARTAMVVSSAVTALAAIGVGSTLNLPLLGIFYCLLCASTVYYNVSWRTYRQGLVAPGLLGRVSASCRSIAYLGVVVGVAGAGALQGAGLSTGVLFGVGGGVALAGTIVVGWALRAQGTTEQPVAPDEASLERHAAPHT